MVLRSLAVCPGEMRLQAASVEDCAFFNTCGAKADDNPCKVVEAENQTWQRTYDESRCSTRHSGRKLAGDFLDHVPPGPCMRKRIAAAQPAGCSAARLSAAQTAQSVGLGQGMTQGMSSGSTQSGSGQGGITKHNPRWFREGGPVALQPEVAPALSDKARRTTRQNFYASGQGARGTRTSTL